MNKNIACVILAAGKSTRMKSDIPKVLHPICGRAMLEYVLDLVSSLGISKKIAVLGYKPDEARKFLRPGIEVALQKNLLGTADAIKQALPKLAGFKGTVLVLYGDTPLLKKETIVKLLEYHSDNRLAATLLTAHLDKPDGYGRVLRDKYFSISGIVEDLDADSHQKSIKEVNTGIICFDKDALSAALKEIKRHNRKKEYYLTDSISLLYKKGLLIDAVRLSDIDEAMGINSRLDLTKANSIMQCRINEDLIRKGVSLVDPRSTFISYGVKIGQDTSIYPFTVIEKNVKIGKRCVIGPFAHLKEGTVLDDEVTAGNFTEIVRSRIGPGAFVKHFSYLGDARVGRSVNIGAGTVTANFDGKNKHITRIKDKAFIGSDSILVAPVSIGRRAKTGAGSVILSHANVPDDKIVAGVPARQITKVRQKNG